MLLPSSRVSISCDMSALIVTESCSCTVSHIRSSISDSAGGSSTPEPPHAVSATSEPAAVMVRSFREILYMASSFFVLRSVSGAEKIPMCWHLAVSTYERITQCKKSHYRYKGSQRDDPLFILACRK